MTLPRAVNRIQGIVLGFFGLGWILLVITLAAGSDGFDQQLKLLASQGRTTQLAYLAIMLVFNAVLCVGVVRRWRWTFWLILVVFLSGILRIPVSILELTGAVTAAGPAWYSVFQAVMAIIQFAIGLTMLRGYRRGGMWGDGGAL